VKQKLVDYISGGRHPEQAQFLNPQQIYSPMSVRPGKMLASIIKLIPLFISASRAIQASSYDGSFTYLVGDNAQPYYSPSPENSTAVGSYAVAGSDGLTESLVPFTVLVTGESEITAQILNDTISSYLEDDVFDISFLDG
jgi:hypothetical protein